MKNKNDMYIKYENSYKKRGKFSLRKWIKPIVFILLLAGFGSGAFYIAHNNKAFSKKEQQPIPQEVQQLTPTVKPSPTPVPSLTPTPFVTLIPSVSAMPEEEPTAITASGTIIEEEASTQVKGIYVTAQVAGSSSVNDLIDLAETTEINAMVIDVKDDQGKITYDMDSVMAQEIGAVSNSISDIESLVAACKEKEIYLIARIVAFKDPLLAEKRPDLAIKNQDGSIYKDSNNEGWVNPYKQEVWDYLIEVASQAAAVGFDEIQFDYIRFSTGDGIAKADFGEEAKTKSKEEIITEFTKYAYEKIKPLGVFMSADVYGAIINSTIDAGLVGQNYVEMSKYLDYICPMIYPSHFGEGNYGIAYPDLEPFEIISKVLKVSKTKLSAMPEQEHKAIVRPWLQDFTATWVKKHQEYGAEELREQIDGVYSAGYEEWILWNSRCNYSVDGLLEE